MPDASGAGKPKEPSFEATEPQGESTQAPAAPLGGPVTVQVGPQGHVTITVQPSAAHTAPEFGLAGPAERSFPELFGGGGQPQEPQPGAFQQVLDQLKTALNTLGEKIVSFTEDVTSLEVRTYVSDRIEDVRPDGANGFTFAMQRAMTYIAFDGDTQVVVPTDAGQIDEALWQIHLQTVELAQAHREAMLKTVGELVAGFIPTLK